jgi:hypothetical protein
MITALFSGSNIRLLYWIGHIVIQVIVLFNLIMAQWYALNKIGYSFDYFLVRRICIELVQLCNTTCCILH